MKKRTLEVCVDSVESALAAVRGGAGRLEVCADLVTGGTTPDPGIFRQMRKLFDIPMNVLIRPRPGDFLYTDAEFDAILDDIKIFTGFGADGIVAGCLTADGSLDVERMSRLRDAAGAKQMTLHRAFDMTADPYGALQDAVSIGVDTILTSGQKNSCIEGMDLIEGICLAAGGRVDIMAGSGVNAAVIERFLSETDVTSFHMSGKTALESGMIFRRSDVNMGMPGIDEYEILRTDEARIREAENVLGV